jgi:MFS superfamily sulfate permease-like transporter
MKIRREDLIASLVVFIVALPLSLGIALASGASPAAGLITAIVGGVVGGMFAGAPLVVAGPAAGLTALLFQLVQVHGLKGLTVITIIAGFFQIVFGAFRTGKLFTYVPKPVLEGMLCAIGFIIGMYQLHILMGATLPATPKEAIVNLPATIAGLTSTQKSAIFVCGLLAMTTQIFWPKWFKKLSWVPSALPAVIFATLLSQLWDMPRVQFAPLMTIVRESVVGLPILFTEMQGFLALATAALGVAFVASAETLLTARAVDVLVEKRKDFKPANLNRELFSQGAANLLSGVMGGLPMTGVIVRSAVNVDAGAVSRMSTILHGVWVAVFVGFFPFVLTAIPLTALAAVLVLTGYRLLNLAHLRHMLRDAPKDGFLWILTSVAIFSTDLLKGLIIALVVAGGMKLVEKRQKVGAVTNT